MAVSEHVRLDDHSVADQPLGREAAAIDLRLDVLDDYAYLAVVHGPERAIFIPSCINPIGLRYGNVLSLSS